jgi:hypothetical protein
MDRVWWANLRSRLLGLPFGDQGLFCRREAYERAGGYRDLVICDDVDIVRRLKRAGPFSVLPEKTVTSPRRYRERGAFRQVLRGTGRCSWATSRGFLREAGALVQQEVRGVRSEGVR